jgi:hypothetical protein
MVAPVLLNAASTTYTPVILGGQIITGDASNEHGGQINRQN